MNEWLAAPVQHVDHFEFIAMMMAFMFVGFCFGWWAREDHE